MKVIGVKITICQVTMQSGDSVRDSDFMMTLSAAMKNTAASMSIAPDETSLKPGRKMINAPMNPMNVADRRRPRAASRSTITAATHATMGRTVMIAASSARGAWLMAVNTR